ncbi:MAG TPA: rhodanese-like domain-containing protein [Mariprofundaceae bacterium]|nr:rhodanese-like domain-containing protein [Mariprofundaceae bacterium]
MRRTEKEGCMKGNRWLAALFIAVALPLSAAACGMGERTPAGYENATLTHAHDHWQQGANAPIPFLFLDVRTPEEYAAGHIPGAKLIPLPELPHRLNEVPKDRQVYVYCHSGKRSARAATLLGGQGFTNIENVVGGIVAWQGAGYPVEK